MFLKRLLPVWIACLLGTASLLLQEPPAALFERAPHLRDWSDFSVRLLLLLNPLLLVTAMAAVGAWVTPKAGLVSRLCGDQGARLAPVLALSVGLGLGAFLVGADRALGGHLGDDWLALQARVDAAPVLPTLLTGMLYGGLAEEVIMRWGLMSLLAWGFGRILGRTDALRPVPSAAAMWAAVTGSALAFAMAHLPVLAQTVALDGAWVGRTILLNGVAGIAYGWLFWRRSLECAIIAHASTHVGWALFRALV